MTLNAVCNLHRKNTTLKSLANIKTNSWAAMFKIKTTYIQKCKQASEHMSSAFTHNSVYISIPWKLFLKTYQHHCYISVYISISDNQFTLWDPGISIKYIQWAIGALKKPKKTLKCCLVTQLGSKHCGPVYWSYIMKSITQCILHLFIMFIS